MTLLPTKEKFVHINLHNRGRTITIFMSAHRMALSLCSTRSVFAFTGMTNRGRGMIHVYDDISFTLDISI
jgi:hypothetical protein